MIYITGSMGFIGSYTIQAFKNAGYDVLGFDKKAGSNLILSDMLDKMSAQKPPNYIVHLAGSCSTQRGLDDPRQDFTDNVMATFNILEIARRYHVPIIYVSTCKVYPDNVKRQRTPYGLSKYVGELYVEEWAKTYGVEFIINRPGTIYGPGQDGSPESGWIGWFTEAQQKNQKIIVNGDGTQSRDILYVTDFVDLLIDQVKNFEDYKGMIYDVGGGEENEVSILDVLKELKYDNFIHGPEREGDVKRFVSDNKEVSLVNGWEPKVSWKEGLERTVNYYKEQFQKMN